MITAFASLPHYLDHLLPVVAELPGSYMLVETDALRQRAQQWLERSRAPRVMVECRFPSERRGGRVPVLVASRRDARRVPESRPLWLLEHGAGQTYQDQQDAGYYAGGAGWDRLELALVPGPHAARHWRASYPRLPVVELQGSPRLDGWARLTPAGGNAVQTVWSHSQRRLVGAWGSASRAHAQRYADTLPPTDSDQHATPETAVGDWPAIAVSFHWHALQGRCPEAGASYRYWLRGIRGLTAAGLRPQLLGHAHPRAWSELAAWYAGERIDATPDFQDVLARAWLYVCDNSSTMYEWAGLGRPVLALSAPQYRRDVEHGLRFWSHVPGLECSSWERLGERVAVALDDPVEARIRREDAVAEAYGGWLDGQATARAVDAIRAHA